MTIYLQALLNEKIERDSRIIGVLILVSNQLETKRIMFLDVRGVFGM